MSITQNPTFPFCCGSLLPPYQPSSDLIVMSTRSFVSAKTCCMVMRINLDCNACCRKARKIILNMKEIESHMVAKQDCRVVVCGRFVPADVAIKLRKKMKRRVEILDIQELGDSDRHEDSRPINICC